MKKVFLVLSCVILTAILSFSAFAATVPSAAGKLAPWVLDVQDKDGNPLPTGELIITPYVERDTLPSNLKTLIEEAYNELENAGSLEAFLKAFGIFDEINATVPVADANVTALFDVYATGTVYDKWLADGEITVVIGMKGIKNDTKVAVAHKIAEEGEWETLPTTAGKESISIKFGAKMSPIAIISNVSSAQTGDNNIGLYIAIGVIVLSAITLVVVAKKRKVN